MNQKPRPGVDRSKRLSEQGLQRLEKQLKSGIRISDPVLEQLIKRYGEAASEIIRRYRPRRQ